MTDGAIVTLDQHVRLLQEGAKKIAPQLGPGGDWVPVIAYTDGDGNARIIEAWPLADRDMRDDYVEAIAAFLRSERATVIAVVHMGYTLRNLTPSHVRKIIDGELPRARESADRIEILMVTGFDSDGTVDRWTADVTRDKQGVPSLGEFTQKPEGEAVTGGLIEPFRWAVVGAVPFDEQYDNVVEIIRDRAAVEEEHNEGGSDATRPIS